MFIVLKVIRAKRTMGQRRRPTRLTFIRQVFQIIAIFVAFAAIDVALVTSPVYATSSPTLNITSAPQNIVYGGSTSATFSISSTPGSSLEVYETLYPKITSRSALLNMTTTSTPSGYPISISSPTRLSSLHRLGSHSYNIVFSVGSNPSASLTVPGCVNTCSGNYPLQIRLANANTGTVYSEVTVPLTIIASAPSKALGTSFLFRYATPSFNPHTFHSVVAFLSTHSSLPFSLAISPSLVVNAESSSLPSVHQDLALLDKWAQLAGHSIVTTTYSPIDPTCISTLKGPISYQSQIQNALVVLQQYQRSGVVKVFATNSPDVLATLSAPTKLGFHRLLVPDTYFSNLAFNITPTAPITLASSSTTILGVDSVLTKEFSNANSSNKRVLATADLSQIYFDAPNDPSQRAVVVGVNISNTYSVSNFGRSLKRVLSDPLIGLVSLNSAFSIPSYKSISGDRLNLASAPSKSCSHLAKNALRKGSRDLQTINSLNTKISNKLQIQRYLLQAESAHLSRAASMRLINKASSLAKKDIHSISVVTNSAFTLTSRKSSIPITVTSRLKVPISIKLELRSLKLQFPGGNVKIITLTHPISTVSFPVAVKTPGSFPLEIVVKAPDGSTIATSTVGVHSEAFSIVGVVLTLGSLGVFLLWWTRSIVRTRRNRRAARST